MKELLAIDLKTEIILATKNNNLQKSAALRIKNNLKTKQTSRVHEFLCTFAISLFHSFQVLLPLIYYSLRNIN